MPVKEGKAVQRVAVWPCGSCVCVLFYVKRRAYHHPLPMCSTPGILYLGLANAFPAKIPRTTKHLGVLTRPRPQL